QRSINRDDLIAIPFEQRLSKQLGFTLKLIHTHQPLDSLIADGFLQRNYNAGGDWPVKMRRMMGSWRMGGRRVLFVGLLPGYRTVVFHRSSMKVRVGR